MPEETNLPVWAIVDLMGHVRTAGRIEMGALLRVDVPDGESYATSFYGMAAIYSVHIVSEEIARAHATRPADIIAYDAPIITREQHEQVVETLRERIRNMQHQLESGEK